MVARNLKQELRTAKGEGSELAPAVIIRPSKLPDALKQGYISVEKGKVEVAKHPLTIKDGVAVIASGVFERAEPNRFNKEKKDFYIKGEDGTLFIINSTQSLEEQMALIEAGQGTKVRIEYAGKITTKSGRTLHDFSVFVED